MDMKISSIWARSEPTTFHLQIKITNHLAIQPTDVVHSIQNEFIYIATCRIHICIWTGGLSKQCRPRSENGVWSESVLFAAHPAFLDTSSMIHVIRKNAFEYLREMNTFSWIPITKTCLFDYIEIFTKRRKIFNLKKNPIFFIFLLKT